MKGNPSETAQSRFWLSFDEILIENTNESVWGSPEQILIDVYLNSNWKWKEIRLTQPRADSDRFLMKV